MAVRQITTKLTVDGEREFKQQISAVNRELGNLGAEMKLVDAQFKGQANSAAALREKQRILSEEVSNSENKVKALEAALKEATTAYGEGDARVDRYQKSLLTAQRQLVETNRALEDTSKYLKEAEDSADGCATSIDGFGKEVKKTADETDGFDGGLGKIGDALKKLQNSDGSFNLKNVLGALGELKGALVGGAIVTGAKEVVDAIFEIVNSTEEYRESMGKLDVAFSQAGYSEEQAAAAYQRFFEVSGDTTASVTAANNLATLGLQWDQLKIAIDGVAGSYVLLGDSVPIDSLSESIADTAELGQVTGNLADVLNRLHINEDDFNKLLENMPEYYERMGLIMSTLNLPELQNANDSFRETADSVISMRDAQMELNDAMAELGETLVPIAAELTSFGAEVVTVATSGIQKLLELIETISNAMQAFDELAEKNAAAKAAQFGINSVKEGIIQQIPFLSVPANIYKGVKWLSGSHADGLDRVPYDGYIAELHANEAVLNAQEAALWRSAARTGTQTTQRASVPTPAPASSQAVSQRQSIILDATFVLGDATVARHLYPLMQSESRRRGTPLAGKEGT